MIFLLALTACGLDYYDDDGSWWEAHLPEECRYADRPVADGIYPGFWCWNPHQFPSYWITGRYIDPDGVEHFTGV